ncbi:hypothetical protein GCM10019017_06240 [Streptomyces showdoensis]
MSSASTSRRSDGPTARTPRSWRRSPEANDLYDESSLAHLDALTYGREYVPRSGGHPLRSLPDRGTRASETAGSSR